MISDVPDRFWDKRWDNAVLIVSVTVLGTIYLWVWHMTILRGKTQQFAGILKSSYLGNGNKSKQNVWEFHRYEKYPNLGEFPILWSILILGYVWKTNTHANYLKSEKNAGDELSLVFVFAF